MEAMRKAKPPPVNPAIAAIMRDELDAKEFGVVGEMAVPRPIEPQPPPQPPLIPPPPWSENYVPELDPDHEPPASEETDEPEEDGR
jgi:hypothetical protein